MTNRIKDLIGRYELRIEKLGGETFQPNWPKGTSLATKVAITQVMGELLQREIKTKRAVMT